MSEVEIETLVTRVNCHKGLFEFKQMPFELANALASSNAPWMGCYMD